MTTIDRERLSGLMERERVLFRERHPRSRSLFEAGRSSLLWGVPMNWMVRWPGDHPVYVAEAEGAEAAAQAAGIAGTPTLQIAIGDDEPYAIQVGDVDQLRAALDDALDR